MPCNYLARPVLTRAGGRFQFDEVTELKCHLSAVGESRWQLAVKQRGFSISFKLFLLISQVFFFCFVFMGLNLCCLGQRHMITLNPSLYPQKLWFKLHLWFSLNLLCPV